MRVFIVDIIAVSLLQLQNKIYDDNVRELYTQHNKAIVDCCLLHKSPHIKLVFWN